MKEIVTPVGAPVALSVTVCAEPEVTAVLTVAVAEPPGAAVPEAGLTATEKSFAGAVVVAGFQ